MIRKKLFLCNVLLTASLSSAGASQVWADVSWVSADELATAMEISAEYLLTSSLGPSDPLGAGIGHSNLGDYFPTKGASFVILATGPVQYSDDANTNASSEANLGGLNNIQGQDMVQYSVELKVPNGATCLQFDVAFYSKKFPELVDGFLPDAFSTEYSISDLNVVDNQILVPNSFAFDTNGNVSSVNSPLGFTQMTNTTYEGDTPLLKAQTSLDPVVFPEQQRVANIFFTLQALENSVYDSAAFIDNFEWLYGPGCTPGANIDPQEKSLVGDLQNVIENPPGDLNRDLIIDRTDINTILSYRNQPAEYCQECDIDKDGFITVLDARKLILECTYPRCESH